MIAAQTSDAGYRPDPCDHWSALSALPASYLQCSGAAARSPFFRQSCGGDQVMGVRGYGVPRRLRSHQAAICYRNTLLRCMRR
ncbi:hypothetical protein ASZ90_010886 [hydrocarbon metagenome]|uniref:Uncharacterized protein n=1 Tax=hydrocarbon metagenome TaxID=938273 RepID=A0A0W8FEQ4_9ZZZZ